MAGHPELSAHALGTFPYCYSTVLLLVRISRVAGEILTLLGHRNNEKATCFHCIEDGWTGNNHTIIIVQLIFCTQDVGCQKGAVTHRGLSVHVQYVRYEPLRTLNCATSITNFVNYSRIFFPFRPPYNILTVIGLTGMVDQKLRW